MNDALELAVHDAFESAALIENYVLPDVSLFVSPDGTLGFSYGGEECDSLWLFFRLGYLAAVEHNEPSRSNVHPNQR